MILQIEGKAVTREEFLQYIVGCYKISGISPTSRCAIYVVRVVKTADNSFDGTLIDTAERLFGWHYNQTFAFMQGFDEAKRERSLGMKYKTQDGKNAAMDVWPDYYALGTHIYLAVKP